MPDRGDRRARHFRSTRQSRSARQICPRMTSNFGRSYLLHRTSILVFLDSMESPLSQEYIHMLEENIRCLTEVIEELVTSGQLVNPGQLVRFAHV